MGSGRKDSSSVTGRMRRDIIITAPKESSKPMLYSAVGSARSMTMALKAIPEGMSYRLPAAAAYRLQRAHHAGADKRGGEGGNGAIGKQHYNRSIKLHLG